MKDMRGQDLAAGDTIVYPFVSRSMGYIRIGTILELVEKKHPYRDGVFIEKAKVEWTEGHNSIPYGSDSGVHLVTTVEADGRALKL